jgi:competence ComEA-like helix-hairpin-helix protein
MNQNTTDLISPRPARLALAALGNSHGYRFTGDSVRLNAMFTVLDPSAYQRPWALQLWACNSTPAFPGEGSGQLIAHAPLPPMGEIADDVEGFEVGAPAVSPAGSGEYVMVLALVTGRDGRFDEVVDFAVFPRAERFEQPRLNGVMGYRLNDGRVRLHLGGLVNPRNAENLSGTLSLELWALPAPYRGGAFNGVALAGVTVGQLPGQYELTSGDYDLSCQQPPVGVWHFVLMLREWTSAGFVTRDFTSFALPVEIVPAPAPAPAPLAVAPVAPVVAAVVVPAEAPAPVKVAAPKATATVEVKPGARLEVKPVARVEVKPVVAPVTKAKVAQPVKSPAAPRPIALNTASADEIRAAAGLPLKVAQAIVKSRPFKSVEDLLRVKGIGERVLAKLRSRVRI